MNTQPPMLPLKRRVGKIWIFAGIVILLFLSLIGFGIKAIIDSGITAGPDAKFGDQHLKTAVALIELHKTRFGKYPSSLADLKFIGEWDGIALMSVHYIPSDDRTSYYVEVTRGWVGKPSLRIPEGFWNGTGYNENLKNTSNQTVEPTR